jgi:uncharacterized protein
MNSSAVTSGMDHSVERNGWTWVGLVISLVSLLALRWVFHPGAATPGTAMVVVREACMFGCAGALVLTVRRGERRSLASVGVGMAPVWRSVVWGLVMAAASVLPAVLIAKSTGYGHGAGSQTFAKLPVWVVLLVVVRAGVVEELFYRGYAMTRLREMGLGRVISFGVPLVMFAAAHWSGGWVNVAMAMAVGAVFAGFFAWRRDVVANMFGHFAVDFAANLLPRMMG